MQHIILSILLQEKGGNSKVFDHVSELAPFFEIDAHWEEEALASWIQDNHKTMLNGRRVFNTHLRFPMLPRGSGGKLVYIVRTPLDVCVSFYHHLCNQVEGCYEGSFESFFDAWLDGKLAFGSWIDHIRSYQQANISASNGKTTPSDGRQLLFVSYESMVGDLRSVVKTLNEFLEVNLSDAKLEEMLPTFSFKAMKSDIDRFQPKSVHWKNEFCFLRRGKVGSSNEVVSDDQKQRFLAKVRESGILTGGELFIDQWLRDIGTC